MATTTKSMTDDPPNYLDISASHQEHPKPPCPKLENSYSQYPRWIGQKFQADGTVLPFSGNTVLCHLSPNSDLYTNLLNLYADIQRQSFAPLYVLLSPSSWHMTVSEGVCDQIRIPDSWPSQLPLNTPLQNCNGFVRQRLSDFDLACDPPSFKMSCTGWEPLEDGIALTVVPATNQEGKRLRTLRDRLADCLGMRHPGHDEYVFHVSMAYTLRYLTQQELVTIMKFLESWRERLPVLFELGAPEFCVFENMFAFRRELYLGEA